MDAHGRPLRKPDGQFELAANSFDIATKCRDVHVRLFFDLRNGRLFDLQHRRDIGLGLASDLAQRSQASYNLRQIRMPCINSLAFFLR